MKQISKAAIAQAVKHGYAEARDWCCHGSGRYYQMMINTDTGIIWADLFLSENDWTVYHTDSIHQLEYVPGYVRETEAEYTDDVVRLLKAAGWDITE